MRERVTDPKGWMHVMIALGDYYAVVEGDQQRAITTYEDAWRNGDALDLAAVGGGVAANLARQWRRTRDRRPWLRPASARP